MVGKDLRLLVGVAQLDSVVDLMEDSVPPLDMVDSVPPLDMEWTVVMVPLVVGVLVVPPVMVVVLVVQLVDMVTNKVLVVLDPKVLVTDLTEEVTPEPAVREAKVVSSAMVVNLHSLRTP